MLGDEITVENITVVYRNGTETWAIRDLSFKTASGEFVCLIGPTGCGKSTILHVIAGFIKPQSGQVLVNGCPIIEPNRGRAVVFQDQNLFFWRTVFGNVEFGLDKKDCAKSERIRKVGEYLDMTGLTGFEERYPSQLSGGERQRVALARAFATEPTTLLLDEPFRSLDAQSRIKVQELLLNIWEKKKRTVLFVTHDLDEAIYLADRVLVMAQSPGFIKKDIPIIFKRPRSYNITLSTEFIEIKKRIIGLL